MNYFIFNGLCECVSVIGVATMDIINGDIWVDEETFKQDPMASNNAYYNACSEYAWAYCRGAIKMHDGEIHKTAGWYCDEHGTAIDKEMWDKCYEVKGNTVVRRPGVTIQEEWDKTIQNIAKRPR